MYTACMLTIATAFMEHGITTGRLNMPLWNSLILKAYRG
jgi:hypothetical protein